MEGHCWLGENERGKGRGPEDWAAVVCYEKAALLVGLQTVCWRAPERKKKREEEGKGIVRIKGSQRLKAEMVQKKKKNGRKLTLNTAGAERMGDGEKTLIKE